MGQREGIEHLDGVDAVPVAPIQAEVASERRCFTTNVNHTAHSGIGQQINDLTPGARSGRVQHRNIGATVLSRQHPSHRIGDHLDLGQISQATRAAAEAARAVSTLKTRPDSPTASPSTAAKTPAPP